MKGAHSKIWCNKLCVDHVLVLFVFFFNYFFVALVPRRGKNPFGCGIYEKKKFYRLLNFICI